MPDEKKEPLMVGGPGLEDAGKKDTPADKATAKYAVGGKEYDLPADVVDALTAAGRGVQEQIMTLQAQLKALSAAGTDPGDKGKKAAGEPALEDLLFLDPKKAIEILEARIEEKLQGRQDTARAQEVFWQRFYEGHKELKPYHVVVKAVLDNSLKELQNLSVDSAIAEIAKRSKALLVKGSKDLQDDDKGDPKGEVEGDSTRRKAPDKKADAEAPTSLSAVIAARKAARTQARVHPGKRE